MALGFTNTLVEISKPSFDEDSQGISTLLGLFYHHSGNIINMVMFICVISNVSLNGFSSDGGEQVSCT